MSRPRDATFGDDKVCLPRTAGTEDTALTAALLSSS